MTLKPREPPLAPEPAQRVGQRLGQCRLRRHLSRGGMGDVYAAEHIHLGRKVAVKLPRLDNHDIWFNQQQLLSEARFLARVAHVNVVAVHDLAFTAEGLAFLVLEYLEGQALDRILSRTPFLQLPVAAHIIREMARGLGACHRSGVLVGDVKPENIMVVGGPLIGLPPQGTVWVKIIDLGGAHRLPAASEDAPPPPGNRVGTPAYSSPELIQGWPLTPASDVYSLGILLYELVAGRPPFDGADDASILRRHVEDVPEPLSLHREELAPDSPLERFVDGCLSKDPLHRPADMMAFLDGLDCAARDTAIARSGDEQLCGDLRPRRDQPRNQRVTRPLAP